MEELFLSFFESTVTTSIAVLILILLSPLLNKAYKAKWKYWVWLILAFRLLIPVNLPFQESPVQIPVPQGQVLLPQGVQNVQMVQGITSPIQGGVALSFIEILSFLWLAGILIFLMHQLISYQFFKKQVLRWSCTIKNNLIYEQFNKVCYEFNIKRKIKILISDKADNPMIVGLLSPVLLLPSEDYTEQDLYFIFKHELVHLRRHDVWYKLFLLFINALHWYNPAIYMMFKEANKDLELSCDDEVTRNASFDNRKLYSETILASVHKQNKRQTVLTTHFYGGYKIMRERFQNILSMKTKRRALLPSLLLILSIIVTGGLVACGTQSSTSDASDVITKYLEAQKNNDNNALNSLLWKADNDQSSNTESEGTLGVISLSIDKVEVSDEETQSIKERYTGSDLAQNYGWSDEFIKENLIAIYAKYTIDYDNTKVPYNDGEITQYFYLVRSDKDSPWRIWEQSYDVVD